MDTILIVIARSDPAKRESDEAISIPLSGIAERSALVGLSYESSVRCAPVGARGRDCHALPLGAARGRARNDKKERFAEKIIGADRENLLRAVCQFFSGILFLL